MARGDPAALVAGAERMTLDEIQRAPQLLSAVLQNGALLNVAQLAQDAGIPPSTASRYLSLLEVSCLVWRVPAFTVNRGKRLSKTPKLFWQDSGLAAHLAGFQDSGQLAESRLSGAWLESWVGRHLRRVMRWISWSSPRDRCCPSK